MKSYVIQKRIVYKFLLYPCLHVIVPWKDFRSLEKVPEMAFPTGAGGGEIIKLIW
jgi:hypothetical protein